MEKQTIKINLSQAIYDLSNYKFINGKPNLKDYSNPSETEKNIKKLKAYILRYLKLFNELSPTEKGDFMNGRKDFLNQANINFN